MGTVYTEHLQAAFLQRYYRVTFAHGYRERRALDDRDQVGCFNFKSLFGALFDLVNKAAYRLQDTRYQTGVGVTCSLHFEFARRGDQHGVIATNQDHLPGRTSPDGKGSCEDAPRFQTLPAI